MDSLPLVATTLMLHQETSTTFNALGCLAAMTDDFSLPGELCMKHVCLPATSKKHEADFPAFKLASQCLALQHTTSKTLFLICEHNC